MILVLLGTFPTQFERPLIAIDTLCREGIIREEVIVQNGFTKFPSEYLTYKPFLPVEELDHLYREARIVISHAGSGSLLKGIKMGKKIIAIPRMPKYGEVVDNHQMEILSEFENENYLLGWRETDQLKELLIRTENFKPKPFISKKQNIIDFLDEYMQSL
ncbi:PssE/Cps14G family polysaccharide biosynthesis glycosyltransferase [Cyclobacterium jeungdonense]|uniref:PssE/Cps14G family polysaccharide biosynthesis glycosyltransferase n=1 Tax=Cyclobacterium jeungdonense TaxID=708087 RepID=A0ABT8C1A1_9BACT|nr:PssE/Cps14G family polysaccharide biosynthesis glycosyltransferase [Cyclobacterium jeungdonense]MDN3686559.1 PssE/Cps14G family polysaccharide biosynthesis glycosyltransferase [Cyclobacterium jeungdonense]